MVTAALCESAGSHGLGPAYFAGFYRFPGVGYQLRIKRPTAPRRIAQILSGELGYGDIAQPQVIKQLLLQRSADRLSCWLPLSGG